MVCAVLFRLFGTVGLFNKLQTQNEKKKKRSECDSLECVPDPAGGEENTL